MEIQCRRLDREIEWYEAEASSKLSAVLKSGVCLYGAETKEFEKKLSDSIGKNNCVSVKNCTDALYLTLRYLGIGRGDEVLVPCNTFVADYAAVANVGAAPIAVDVNEYYSIDPAQLEKQITPKTRAILVVHLYGQAADMDEILAVAERHDLVVVEDCAQAFGAEYKGKPVGSFGDVSCFSFYPTKNLGAFGDGGAILTDDDEMARRLRAMRFYGINEKGEYEAVGVNSRIDELQAAILNAKFKYLDDMLAERRRIASRYLSGINNPTILLPKTAAFSKHTFHQFVIRCEERDKLKDYLETSGIQTQIHYKNPPFLSSLYAQDGQDAALSDFSANLHKSILSLPMYIGMTDDEITYVIDAINRF